MKIPKIHISDQTRTMLSQAGMPTIDNEIEIGDALHWLSDKGYSVTWGGLDREHVYIIAIEKFPFDVRVEHCEFGWAAEIAIVATIKDIERRWKERVRNSLYMGRAVGKEAERLG